MGISCLYIRLSLQPSSFCLQAKLLSCKFETPVSVFQRFLIGRKSSSDIECCCLGTIAQIAYLRNLMFLIKTSMQRPRRFTSGASFFGNYQPNLTETLLCLNYFEYRFHKTSLIALRVVGKNQTTKQKSGLERGWGGKVWLLPFFLSRAHTVLRLPSFLFALYPTWEPVHRLFAL